jgi:transmembrane protein 231
MWVKTTTFVAQPTVRFKYDVLMVFEGATPGKEKVWSTFASVNKLMAGSLASVDVQVSEQDLNMDGKIDVIDVKATAKGLGNVHGVKVLMGFDYAIDGMVDLALNGLAVAQHASPLPGSGYFVDGHLRLNQRDAIASGTTRLVYNNSVFPFAAHGESAGDAREAASLRLPVILNAYNFRNETTFLDAQTPVWETAASSDFTFNARIRIPTSQRVLYKPGFLELCKFAWVQILAIYVIFLWLFTKFEYVVFHHRLVNTRVVHDMTPKSHRF